MVEVGAALMMQKNCFRAKSCCGVSAPMRCCRCHPDAGCTGAPLMCWALLHRRKVLGMLHLTNYRLKFKPAAPSEPDFSIMLPAIASMPRCSFLFTRKVRLTMQDGTSIEFMKWGIPSFISAVNAVAMMTRQLDWNAIDREITAAPDMLGAWSIPARDSRSTARPPAATG